MRTTNATYDALKPFEGATVERVFTRNDKYTMGETMPGMVFRLRNGQTATVEFWRDEEGNGPGAFVVLKATKPAGKNTPIKKSHGRFSACRICGALPFADWDLCTQHYAEIVNQMRASGCTCKGLLLNARCLCERQEGAA